jgi:hypothetical protein
MPDINGIPYVESDDLVSAYPAVSQSLAQEVSDQLASKLDASAYVTPGLELVTTETFSGVSSVSLNSCFSGDYDSYRIVISNATGSVSVNDWLIRVRASGTDLTGSVYTYQFIYNTQAAGPTRAYGVATHGYLGYLMDEGTMASFDIASPFDTVRTQSVVAWQGFSAASTTISGVAGFTVDNATSYDGFTIYLNSGTMSGTIRVYGYKD